MAPSKSQLRLVKSQPVRRKRTSQEFYEFRYLKRNYDDMMASEICGDSLEPAVPRGSWVLIAPHEPIECGDLAAFRFPERTDLCLRYVYFAPGGWIRLQSSDREQWPDIIRAPGTFEVVGKVVHREEPKRVA